MFNLKALQHYYAVFELFGFDSHDAGDSGIVKLVMGGIWCDTDISRTAIILVLKCKPHI